MNYAMPLNGAKSLPAWEQRQSRLPLLIRAAQGTPPATQQAIGA
jgi:hypothetical protein